MNFMRARSRAFVRRALTAAIVFGLIVAWAHAGIAGGGPPYYVDAYGVIRSIGKPPPTPTPTPAPALTRPPTAQPYGVIRSIGKPPPTPTPEPTPATPMKKPLYQYGLSQNKKVFTIMRNGTPWVTVTQTTGGVQISDPAGSGTVLDIAGGAK